ncbi:MAG TPA: AgmX/PglI C-terminal domain-containing protein [Myxococcaceae bacterium]|nr:AgmX/PglI C-terminal domain-containing protein [Myxococcaceae bacterium]
MDSHPKETDPPLGGDWLYRQGSLVLGPVTGAELVKRLYEGTLGAHTEVALVGTHPFRPVAETEVLRLFLAKAQAKWRVDAHDRQVKERRRRARNLRLVVVGGLAVAGATAAAAGARYLAVHNPWRKDTGEPTISVEPPTITLARARRRDDDLVDYPLDRSGGARPTRATVAPGPRASGKGGAQPAEPDADGLNTAPQFDRTAIMAMVAQKQRALYPCFAEEARRSPGLNARIPVEFTIGNDGHVTKVWVDHAQYREGPLPDCLLRELQKWPFRPYEGERANVGLSFTVGRTG